MGCCIGNCCVFNCLDCGFCCVFKCSDCGDCCVSNVPLSLPCSDCNFKNISKQEQIQIDFSTVVANELADMRRKATERAKTEEENILKNIDASLNDFIKWIETENQKDYDGTKLNLNIDKIKKLNDSMRNEVVGFIGKQLDNRLVKGDRELSPILAERDNKTRKRNFNAFYERVYREAILALVKKIDEEVHKQSDSIEREIQNRLNEVKRNMNDEVKAYEELQNIKLQEESKLAEKQTDYMYYENLCEILLSNTNIDFDKGK